MSRGWLHFTSLRGGTGYECVGGKRLLILLGAVCLSISSVQAEKF